MTCSVKGCPTRARQRGWCSKHYKRFLRHGDPTKLVREGFTRDRDPLCTIEDCDHPHEARGLCKMHYSRRWRGSEDPSESKAQAPKPKGDQSPRWQGQAISYSGVHYRLKVQRGPAQEHDCTACDSRATQWAYDHRDPKEKFDELGRPYSTDLSRYQPMCVPCHKAFDLEHVTSRAKKLLEEATSVLDRLPRKEEETCRVHRSCAYRDDDPARCPWCHVSWKVIGSVDYHSCVEEEFLDAIIRHSRRLARQT